ADSHIATTEIQALAAGANLSLADGSLEDWSTLLSGLNSCARSILELPDYVPAVDLNLYPRTGIHRPSSSSSSLSGEGSQQDETDKGGWAWKATVRATKPSSDLLKGVRLAVKDNIAVAGVTCTNGTDAVPDWIPDVDASIVKRVLDAGAVILGKAACENNCFGAVSDTSVTGPVHNPYADGYSTGGSSSGCGRLVATGSVDMALGADQGGSIRLPSAHCGLVGLKPTWGLVPYTGCISLEATIDHVGPMTRTVQECATLLEVIAGSDGIDDRQPYDWPIGKVPFGTEIRTHLSTTSDSLPLKGLRVGVLQESFDDALMNDAVAQACHAAIAGLARLGAAVSPVSIPLHRESGMIWMVALPMAGTTQGLLASPTGRKQLLFGERSARVGGPQLSQAAFDALGPGGQNIYLRGLFLSQRYGAPLHARCTNLLRKLSDAYDAALAGVDVLVTPTIVYPAGKIVAEGNPGKKLGVLKMLSRTVGATYNTATFNSTGHPGLNLPVGFVPAADDETGQVWLPTGLQIVGRKFEDLTCLKVAASWEKDNDWKTLRFSGEEKA
ncbi:amidase, partial [Phlyctema vagabunda]